MMSESSKRHSKFLSLIFILKYLSKASVIQIRCNMIIQLVKIEIKPFIEKMHILNNMAVKRRLPW